MHVFNNIWRKLGGIAKAITRFPITFLLLVSIAVFDAITIQNHNDFQKQIITLVFGCFCFIVARVFVERFCNTFFLKTIPHFLAAVLTVVYYFLILPSNKITMAIGVRTGVAVFALLIAFIWIPSFKGKTDFNTSFMCFFKSFFTSIFFSGIIFGGISLIIAAVNTLLITVNENAYSHTANIVWVVWAPMLLLSLIPIYGGNEIDEEKVKKASGIPKFLEVLLSYVLVPLASIYTLVLLLYIVKTIISGNWYDNYLEPLTISYCAAVLIIHVLLSKLENKFAKFFKMVFPKLLIPIALFQIISSFIVISKDGIIISRYFVLMFAMYSVICGVLLSILPNKKNGIIAFLAIVFALICITPKIDFFSLSIASQSTILQTTLEKNNMLSNNTITANSNVSDGDKTKITESLSYLNSIDETDRLTFLPENFNYYNDFGSTFGFNSTDTYYGESKAGKYFYIDSSKAFNIDGYDYLSNFDVSTPYNTGSKDICTITQNGETYHLLLNATKDNGTLIIKDSSGTEIISMPLEPMFDSINELESGNEKGMVSADKMTFNSENSAAKIKVVFSQVNISGYSSNQFNEYANAHVLFSIK